MVWGEEPLSPVKILEIQFQTKIDMAGDWLALHVNTFSHR
jgi:hypothetical protein